MSEFQLVRSLTGPERLEAIVKLEEGDEIHEFEKWLSTHKISFQTRDQSITLDWPGYEQWLKHNHDASPLMIHPLPALLSTKTALNLCFQPLTTNNDIV
jgi:hypothetical protein